MTLRGMKEEQLEQALERQMKEQPDLVEMIRDITNAVNATY